MLAGTTYGAESDGAAVRHCKFFTRKMTELFEVNCGAKDLQEEGKAEQLLQTNCRAMTSNELPGNYFKLIAHQWGKYLKVIALCILGARASLEPAKKRAKVSPELQNQIVTIVADI